MSCENEDDGDGTMLVIGVLIILLVGMVVGGIFGTHNIHKQWKEDAIERCSKIQTVEWCRGRAEIERW